jgi:tetratricopeptide (TPR) repeat protein
MGESVPHGGRSRRSRTQPVEPAPWDRRREAPLLEELERVIGGDEVGTELWRGIRCVRAWIDRGAPSGEEAGHVAVFGDVLQALALLVSLRQNPVPAAQVGAACRGVFDWASRHGLPETALQYMEAAAEAEPENPEHARMAGMAAVRVDDFGRSEVWYLRAIGLARKRHRPEYALAQIRAGRILYVQRQFLQAWKYYRRGTNMALSVGRRGLAADGYHNIMLLASAMSSYRYAEKYARKVLALSPLRWARLPYFVHDYAAILLETRLFEPAYQILSMVLPVFDEPSEQVLVWGSLAWAAAGAGDRTRFDDARERVLALAPAHREHGAAALRGLAHGARGFHEWEVATEAAVLARQISVSRGDPWDEVANTELWTQIGRREPLLPAIPPARTDVPGLVAQLESRLARWHHYRERDRSTPGKHGDTPRMP